MSKNRGSKGRLKRDTRLVDMSVPPEQRRRKREDTGTAAGTPAQMSHATSPKARKKARQGEKRVHEDRYGS